MALPSIVPRSYRRRVQRHRHTLRNPLARSPVDVSRDASSVAQVESSVPSVLSPSLFLRNLCLHHGWDQVAWCCSLQDATTSWKVEAIIVVDFAFTVCGELRRTHTLPHNFTTGKSSANLSDASSLPCPTPKWLCWWPCHHVPWPRRNKDGNVTRMDHFRRFGRCWEGMRVCVLWT